MKQNSFKIDFFSFPPFYSFFLIRFERLQEERGESTAVFAVQSDLLNTEGRKDKRKQKHCWSLSTGRAWLEVSLQQAHWQRNQPITRAAGEGKAALPLANCFSLCHFTLVEHNVSGINLVYLITIWIYVM